MFAALTALIVGYMVLGFWAKYLRAGLILAPLLSLMVPARS